ncbi:MAG TPA: phytanoyl-CoA dioxygenase family protein [Ohtaekwangia sp.]|uniref:phytanoyl-CoA dioxygenase family protein n=1 Tax=Ohtaekwangia sp. TaxID=2066019 RepID=UPI002F92B3BF
MEYSVGKYHFSYHSQGEKTWGEEKVLLDESIDLTAGTPWHATGFTIEKLFDDALYAQFAKNVYSLLISRWQQAGLPVDYNFTLSRYHTVAEDFATHLKAVDKTKLLNISEFPVAVHLLEERISEICKTSLITKNPFDQQRVFHFRVIRPSKTDNNPLHRDIWLEDYDNCINLYIPIAGSNELTSLMMIPGSHTWPESKIERTVKGADINGIKYNVPAVTAIKGNFTMLRPSPNLNEVLVFSPYLIHGGSINSSKDDTRISIEIRLWKRSY